MNRQTLIGYVGADAEEVTFNSGGRIAKFSVATTDTWKDKTTGEKKEKTEWHNLVVHGSLVDFVILYVKKGTKVFVEGKTTHRSYETAEGKRDVCEIVLTNILLLNSKASE